MQQELFEKRKLLPLILFHVFNTSNCLNWSCPRTFYFTRKQQWLQNWKVKHSNSISCKILVPFLSLCIRSRLALIPTCSCEGLSINTFSGDHVFWILAWIRNIHLCSLSFLCSILSCSQFSFRYLFCTYTTWFSHAYSKYTNTRNFTWRELWVVSVWSLNNLVHGSSTVTLPWVRLLNTDQLRTEPWGTLQFVYWAAMSLSDSTLSHMLILANWPLRVCLRLKPPPIESCSCPSTRAPPALSV